MLTYAPTCRACQLGLEDTFFKSCAGCQERRRLLFALYEPLVDEPPPPSINKEPECPAKRFD